MFKVYIADPALKTYQGHHFNVTMAFARALVSQGVPVVLLANRSFVGEADKLDGIPVKAVFATDTYSLHKKPAPIKTSGGTLSGITVSSAKNRTPVPISPTNLRSRVKDLLRPVYMTLFNDRQLILMKSFLKWLLSRERSGPVKGRQKETAVVDGPGKVEGHGPKQVESANTDTLIQVLEHCGVTAKDFVFFHTSDAITYQDILRLFSEDVPVSRWQTLPIFVLSTPYDEVVMPHNKGFDTCEVQVRRLNRLGVIGKKVFLYAENQLLARHLAELFETEVRFLPLPFEAVQARPVTRSGDEIVFSYLGAARTEKGFVQVAGAVSRFLEQDSSPRARFVIQASPQILGYTGDIAEAVNRLKKIEDSRLVLLLESQSPEDYDRAISDADCLFLCYDEVRYRHRSSGIAVETLVNGKNAIVTPGTFPAYLLGEACIPARGEQQIVEAIKACILNREAYRLHASTRRSSFLEECVNASLFVELGLIRSMNVAVDFTENLMSETSMTDLSYKKLV